MGQADLRTTENDFGTELQGYWHSSLGESIAKTAHRACTQSWMVTAMQVHDGNPYLTALHAKGAIQVIDQRWCCSVICILQRSGTGSKSHHSTR